MKRYLTASIVVVLASAFPLGASAGASVSDKGKPKATKAETSLINNHVPPATASSCQGKTADEKKYLLKNFPSQKSHIKTIVAAVECFPTTQGSPDEVDYVQTASLNDLLDLYQASLDFYSLKGGPGPQRSPLRLPGRSDVDHLPRRGLLRSQRRCTLGTVPVSSIVELGVG